ncbi:2-amino-4-hydroxy-6-hydroxymethyldihydropteridine diphosphokinase [Paraburkholderia tropica]|uniref:2-amino-4-hydroxy-6-hydroxymethyldihydropteridine pyrophosphokinase n=1 Tax=Paraburkholderia tropica TaxID=92647 RepID=A0AAQ1GCC7_9BURK|nr:2-amino-4-hydroxy-6-hydroxymethyldihydropteridine diphosphokinase [Paraburkholderia tropica]RQN35094.1 2-amino-4-hydroxy-6-hydroxymethyldihydropteridine diphosphokinase [Paraburkholderia tropica]SEJ07754.1 2-amino-4-hydroxy-6-hydroxymethyldihydropteridinediphosphokinase [Paraburkholderia tropica]
MTVAWLGIGANLGDARQTLKDTVVCLAQQHSITVLAKSSLYRTAPIDAGGDDYFNCVVKLDTRLAVRELLGLCHRVEHHFGRERPFRNAPRTLDIDILLYGGEIIDEPDLMVPHPRMTVRAFVLAPLAEVDPELEIPGKGRVSDFLPGVADQRIEKMKPLCQCLGMASQAPADASSNSASASTTVATPGTPTGRCG